MNNESSGIFKSPINPSKPSPDDVKHNGKVTNTTNKPPIGVVPHYIWVLERGESLQGAIQRYLQNDMSIPIDWIKEYNHIIDFIKLEGLDG